jgi:hypothetical protein
MSKLKPLILTHGGRIAELYALLPKDLSRAILALTSNDNYSNKLGLIITEQIRTDLRTHPVGEIQYDGALYELLVFIPEDPKEEQRLFLIQKHVGGKMLKMEEYLSLPSMLV